MGGGQGGKKSEGDEVKDALKESSSRGAKTIKGVSGLSVSTVSDGRRAESCVETEGGGAK